MAVVAAVVVVVAAVVVVVVVVVVAAAPSASRIHDSNSTHICVEAPSLCELKFDLSLILH